MLAQFLYYMKNHIDEDVNEPLLNETPKASTSTPKVSLIILLAAISVLILDALLVRLILGSDGLTRAVCDEIENQSSLLDILGSVFSWFSGLLFFTSRIPQVYKNFQTRSVGGLSM